MIYLQMGILILDIGLCYLINNVLKDTLNKKIRYAICIALLLNCWNIRTYQAMQAIHTPFCLFVLLIVFKKRKPNFHLLDGDFVDESTSKDDMEILFDQLGRLTKVAPVYYVYGNHENKIKFTRNNITILSDQEVHLNNIILICRKDYTNKKPKEYNLTTKTYNVVLDHQPQGTKENIKNNVDLNSADILITDKCFHSLILTIYNLTLPVITAKKHSSTAQKSLVQALWVGVFL